MVLQLQVCSSSGIYKNPTHKKRAEGTSLKAGELSKSPKFHTEWTRRGPYLDASQMHVVECRVCVSEKYRLKRY